MLTPSSFIHLHLSFCSFISQVHQLQTWNTLSCKYTMTRNTLSCEYTMTRTCAFSFLFLVASSCCSWRVVNSFSPSSSAFAAAGRTFSEPRKSFVNIHHAAAKKKGFGNIDEQDSKKNQRNRKTNKEQVSSSATTTATTTLLSKQQPQKQQQQQQQPLNDGQKALAEMRRQNAEKRDAELRKVREMKMADDQVQEAGPAAIPEKVAQRMGARMLPFVGVPLFLGLLSFVGFWYMATYKDLEFQPAMVATTTIIILATSLVGITYSVMSASWDEDREGDLLGVDEFQKNIGNIKEGLGRSRENAILRDRMANIGPDEMNMALTDLERREKAQQKKQQREATTLESKLKDELD